MLQIHGVGK